MWKEGLTLDTFQTACQTKMSVFSSVNSIDLLSRSQFFGFCMHLFCLGGMMMWCLRTKPVVKPKQLSDSSMTPSGMISIENFCINTWSKSLCQKSELFGFWSQQNLLICSLYLNVWFNVDGYICFSYNRILTCYS